MFCRDRGVEEIGSSIHIYQERWYILMKRSELNQIMRDALTLIAEHRFALPPFVTWTMEDWRTKGREYDEIRDNMLG